MDGRPSPRPRPRATGRSHPSPQPPQTKPEVRFHPDRRYTALAGGGVVGALLAALESGDPAGRLLAAVAGILLLAYVVSDLVFSPRLIASADGVTVRSPFVRARLGWPEITEVRADTRSRLGLRSTTLEIDAGPTLAVLTRRSLGAEPVEVAELVEAFRPPTPSGT